MQLRFSGFFTHSLWRNIHIYLALAAGLLFAVLGLTGSLSVYREELDRFFNPHLAIAAPRSKPLSLDKIYAAVRAAHPQRYGAWTLEMPASSAGMITAWFEKPHETIRELYAPLMVSVNPYTGEVAASRFWGQTVTTWLLDLHTQLRMGKSGWYAVGVTGLLLMASAISGLYLWWPGWPRLRQALAVRHDAGLMRLLLDLHRSIGMASAAFLLILAFTGLQLAFPSILEILAGTGGMAHGDVGPDVRSTALPNNRPISLSEALAVARGPFPHAEVRRVTTPDGENGAYRINLRQAEEINQRHPFTTVWVDRWSGQILEVRNPQTFSPAQLFAAWMWPLHTGEALGSAGRLLWFSIGLAPLLLYIAGIAHWLHKRGVVGDRAVDLPGCRRAAIGYCKLYIIRPLLVFYRILYPQILRLMQQSIRKAKQQSLVAAWYGRIRVLVEEFKKMI